MEEILRTRSSSHSLGIFERVHETMQDWDFVHPSMNTSNFRGSLSTHMIHKNATQAHT